jgi:hypothetical protein
MSTGHGLGQYVRQQAAAGFGERRIVFPVAAI